LAATKVGRVQTAFQAGNDFFLRLVAAQHVGVGHARHRNGGVAFTPAVAGGRHAHQARIQRVLDVALQDAVFDQHVALRSVAFVVDVQRAAAIRDGAVVEHGHALGRDAFTDLAAKSTGALAVEVTFEPVADGLVQQHAGPARAEHDAHFARLGGARFKVGQRRVHRVLHVAFDHVAVKISKTEAPTATTATDLAAHFAVDGLLGDHRDRQAHQRAHIGGQGAVGTRHQHHIVFTCQPGHDLHDARILGSGQFFNPFQQRHLLRAVERGNRVHRCVQHAAAGHLDLGADLDAPILAARSDRAHGPRGVHQRSFGDVVRVGERSFLAGHRAHAHALVDAEAAALDDAFFKAPAFAARVLEVQVGIVDAVRGDGGERLAQGRISQAEGFEQQ